MNTIIYCMIGYNLKFYLEEIIILILYRFFNIINYKQIVLGHLDTTIANIQKGFCSSIKEGEKCGIIYGKGYIGYLSIYNVGSYPSNHLEKVYHILCKEETMKQLKDENINHVKKIEMGNIVTFNPVFKNPNTFQKNIIDKIIDCRNKKVNKVCGVLLCGTSGFGKSAISILTAVVLKAVTARHIKMEPPNLREQIPALYSTSKSFHSDLPTIISVDEVDVMLQNSKNTNGVDSSDKSQKIYFNQILDKLGNGEFSDLVLMFTTNLQKKELDKIIDGTLFNSSRIHIWADIIKTDNTIECQIHYNGRVEILILDIISSDFSKVQFEEKYDLISSKDLSEQEFNSEKKLKEELLKSNLIKKKSEDLKEELETKKSKDLKDYYI